MRRCLGGRWWALLLLGRQTVRASSLDTEIHKDGDIRLLVVASRVGMTSWRTTKKPEFGGINLHRLLLQPIFDLD